MELRAAGEQIAMEEIMGEHLLTQDAAACISSRRSLRSRLMKYSCFGLFLKAKGNGSINACFFIIICV
jgi:hypothetical protein